VIPKRISYSTLPEVDCLRLNDFFNAMRLEYLPDDPPVPLEQQLLTWRTPSDHWVSVNFVLEDAGTVMGIVSADWHDDDVENPDLCWGNVIVAPEFRQRGLGMMLFRRLLKEITGMGRKKVFFETTGRLNAGELFAERIGSKRGLEHNANQLLFSELNREYVQRSLKNAPRDRFELGFMDSVYPESERTALCELFDVMNTAPRGELEMNDGKLTPTQMLDYLENEQKRGIRRRLVYVRDRISGRYVGFSEVNWHPSRPDLVVQDGTAVHPDFRGHGLGAWLKAAMIDRILREHPDVNKIRTSNAESNEPMIKINRALGFEFHLQRTIWQLDVQETLGRLRSE
jgi:mycothiol synthase